MTKRCIRVVFDLEAMQGTPRTAPFSVTSADVVMKTLLQVYTNAGKPVGVLEVDMSPLLSDARRATLAALLTALLDPIEKQDV